MYVAVSRVGNPDGLKQLEIPEFALESTKNRVYKQVL